MSTLKCRVTLINLLCRICGKEDKRCIPVFSETGESQKIQKKIRACLPVVVEETDKLPKQICLECLHKLDVTWDLINLCKDGQIAIQKKLESILENEENDDQVVENMCGVCKLEVSDTERAIGCEGKCQRWHHCRCIEMSSHEYYQFVSDTSRIWICTKCKKSEQHSTMVTIEDKIRGLSEVNTVNLGESAIISLAPQSPPPVASKTTPASQAVTSSTDTVIRVMPMATTAQVSYMQPQVTDSIQQSQVVAAPAPAKENIYPEGLIQVNPASKPVLYQQRADQTVPMTTHTSATVSAPRRSIPKPISSQRRSLPPTPIAKRRINREGDSNSASPAKRSHQMCNICNKTFPDDIIDHHISLHLRQSFFTCLDCNKNFRSEMAMSRHRCGVNNTINLDPDDEPICL